MMPTDNASAPTNTPLACWPSATWRFSAGSIRRRIANLISYTSSAMIDHSSMSSIAPLVATTLASDSAIAPDRENSSMTFERSLHGQWQRPR